MIRAETWAYFGSIRRGVMSKIYDSFFSLAQNLNGMKIKNGGKK